MQEEKSKEAEQMDEQYAKMLNEQQFKELQKQKKAKEEA